MPIYDLCRKLVKKMIEASEFHTQKGYELADRQSTGLSSTMEDYLEMIYRLSAEVIRINNLAAHLNVTPSAVSRMAENLRRAGYIHFQRYGFITLTEEGKKMGHFLLWRHDVINRFLCLINQSDGELEETERIEHFLSPQTVANMEIFLSNLSQ